MLLKILRQEKITQTSSANNEHKHSEIEHFSTLNERFNHTIVEAQKTPIIVNCQ